MSMYRYTQNVLAIFFSAAVVSSVCNGLNNSARAAVVVNATGTPYTQDFDGLISTGSGTFVDDSTINGWIVNSEEMDTNNDDYFANDGGSTGGEVYSYGSDGSSDRALGYLGSGGNDYFNAAVVLENGTGTTINDILISFVGEQWRSGGNTSDNQNVLTFAWQVGASITVPASTSVAGWTVVNALEFSAPQPNVAAGPLDGNDAANQTSFSGVSVAGLSWADGQQLALRWVGNDGAGTDAGLAIDNVSVTAVPEPSTLAFAGLGIAVAGWTARRRRLASATKAAA